MLFPLLSLALILTPILCAGYYLLYRLRFRRPPSVEQSFALWFGIIGPILLLIPVLVFFTFVMSFWQNVGKVYKGTQTHQWRLPSGDTLVNETHFTYGWQDGSLDSSTLAIRWKETGETELVDSASETIPNMHHYAIATNASHYVIAAGSKVYYRKQTEPKGAWDSWQLNASPEIYAFINQHLDTHFPGSYRNESARGATNVLAVPGNFSQLEYPMRISPSGRLWYEIDRIDLERGQLTAVPFAKNHLLPALVFSASERFSEWKFDEEASALANSDRASVRE